LRVPWYWPWEDDFTWPWGGGFHWPWDPDFCWPWESCWIWPWQDEFLDFVTCRQAWEPIDEPDCGVFDDSGQLACDAEQQPDGVPLFGIADTHAHPFSNLAFGGALQWGSPFDERGINHALAWGDYTWDFSTLTGPTPLPSLRQLLRGIPGLAEVFPEPLGVFTLPTPNGFLIHAAPMALFMAFANGEEGWHSPNGPPDFSNWPD
jgi:hypothetical protein